MMLSKLSLKNYKSFKSLDELDLRKLTIIVGRNSCGKSSILQSLLLLKQTLESKVNAPLIIQGPHLTYSGLQDISFGKPQVNHAKIGYTFETLDAYGDRVTCSFDIGNKKVGENYQPSVSSLYIEKEDAKMHLDKKPSDGKIEEFISKVFKTKKNEKLDYEYKGIRFDAFIPEAYIYDIKFNNGVTHEFDIPYQAIHSPINMIPINRLKDTISRIKYLSPVRANPTRDYINYASNPNELDQDGTNAAHILWAKKKDTVKWKKEEFDLIDALSECLNCMGLSQKITPEKVGEIIYRVELSERNASSNVSLADVGFGYSQILPVILLGLLSRKGDTVLLEQPEIHLHPSSAANLADLFLGFIKDDKKFMVETHSPELINRLRLRVIENPELKNDINIVFVESTEGEGSKVKQFEIDENGMFPEWPDGFIDESKKIADAIINARLAKGEDEW
ncbi:DUF3696 domain-containing protein [Vibrio parahaemolyticus]|uniref:DUF3696 domain-containing protein n=1 Tax=Vibrio parahaemolyticus TaxID=670 RepID=UPI0009AFB082|nr:DUF3696 domain-containing protein [Vibrio parahaemolyticus]EGR2773255.1 DUF3696 domain-containing protein [Vibrio parahaemolyticus]EGR2834682.1 DUF3696 domain-containing protein [Vibrio parahaemolyticus]EGR2889148.1 DUF3696 domain-containing protein [Vibrio parahaemolyticus]EGR2906765.1 DUF3696 domain-containing protein [Vibrio parahaemolyticus]EGR2941292.1 DUF3696 domain-containing protein [Vibrio parahaemolyticus]